MKNFIKNFEKHFWNQSNKLIGHSDGSLLSPKMPNKKSFI